MAYKAQSNPPSTTRSYDSFIQGWYDEVKDWPAGNVASFSSAGTTGVTGHYTQVGHVLRYFYILCIITVELNVIVLLQQVVWGETQEVGCGYIAYNDEAGWYKQVLICNYGIGGNMLRDPLYNTDTTASCPSGSTEDDGLCVW